MSLRSPLICDPRPICIAPAATRPLLQSAEKGAAAGGAATLPGPDNFQIAPTIIPWKEYKNEYYEKRGYNVASKDWKVRCTVIAERRR